VSWIRSRRRWLVAALAAAVVIVAAGLTWRARAADDSTTAQSITATATVGDATRSVSGSGTLQPAQSETLSFAVSGTVTQVLVALGDQVTEGQELATVDDALLQSQLTAAQSTVTAAEDDLETAASGSSSVRLAAAQAQLVVARDDLTSAEQAVTNAVLRAPFTGEVVALDLTVGQTVSASGGTSAGSGASGAGGGSMGGTAGVSVTTASSSAGTIQVASVIQFVVDTAVSSTDLASIRTGLQAEITATGVTDKLYGTVTEVSRVATTSSSGSAAFPVTVTLTGNVDGVYGGTSATIQIIVAKRSDVLTIPTRAVHSENGTTYVTVVADGKEPAKRTVTVGETYGTNTEVTAGLTKGEKVEVISLPAGVGTGGNRGTGNGQFPGGGQLPGGGQFPGDGQMPGGGQFPGGGGFPGGAIGGNS